MGRRAPCADAQALCAGLTARFFFLASEQLRCDGVKMPHPARPAHPAPCRRTGRAASAGAAAGARSGRRGPPGTRCVGGQGEVGSCGRMRAPPYGACLARASLMPVVYSAAAATHPRPPLPSPVARRWRTTEWQTSHTWARRWARAGPANGGACWPALHQTHPPPAGRRALLDLPFLRCVPATPTSSLCVAGGGGEPGAQGVHRLDRQLGGVQVRALVVVGRPHKLPLTALGCLLFWSHRGR